jgi:hypothetical protein
MVDYTPWFTRVEPICEFPIVRRGVALDRARVFRCVKQTDPFLFGYAGEGPVPRPSRAGKPGSTPADAPAVARRPAPEPAPATSR